MNLVELQNKIHEQNKELGWWDEPRPFSTFVCLFHSELSEAMEGDRKNMMDDHLPQYPMFQVELADFVIRCLDWLGSDNYKTGDYAMALEFRGAKEMNSTEIIAWCHHSVSLSLDCHNNSRGMSQSYIASALKACFEYSEGKFDLHKIILDKVEYNKHRADHKRENRAKQGGKKY